MTIRFSAEHAAVVASMAAILDEYLLPDHVFALGEKDSFLVGGAQITMIRRGNATGVPETAQTFQVEIIGGNFAADVRCVWEGRFLYQPVWTHLVTDIRPDTRLARSEFIEWLRGL